jgi:hypothetical protein
MGDRCSITVRIPHFGAMPAIEILKILVDELGEPDQDDSEDGQGYDRLTWHEVNGGAGCFFMELPEKHPALQVEVTNEPGMEYGSGVILLTGDPEEPIVEFATLQDDYRPAVPVNESGPDADMLEEAMKYWKHVKIVFPNDPSLQF